MTKDDRKCRRELKTLARFISIYCKDLHSDQARKAVTMKTCDVKEIAGRDVILCPDCTKLLIHALTNACTAPWTPSPCASIAPTTAMPQITEPRSAK